jgi:dolichol-phosphate mannosyltransferase
MTIRCCLVVPMYNEESGCEVCVRTIAEHVSRLPGEWKLLVVNDGSRDATPRLLSRLTAEIPLLTVITHPTNRGYGAALRTGMRYAIDHGYAYALFLDSDLTNHPKWLVGFAAQMERGIDVIKASRYIPGGGIDGVPWPRFVISYVGNRIARTLYRLPLHDVTNGFRAVRTDILSRLDLREEKFAIIMEELWQESFLARTWAEVPVILTNRSAEQRVTSFHYRPRIFWDYLKYPLRTFFRMRPRNAELANDGLAPHGGTNASTTAS